MNKLNARRHRFLQRFSLIELLIVIVIIGLLSALLIQQFGNFSEDAKTAVDKSNLSTLQRHLVTFNAANGHYPSSLHTGLNATGTASIKKVEDPSAWPTVETSEPFFIASMAQNIDSYTVAVPEDVLPAVRKSLAEGGVRNLLFGFDDYDGTPILDLDKTLPLRSISSTGWFDTNGGTFNYEGYPIQKWNDNYYYIPLFVSNRTQWGGIYDTKGNYVGASKVKLDEAPQAPLPEGSTKANYYALIFRVKATSDGAKTFSPAEFLGVYSPNDASLGAGKALSSDGKTF